MAGFRRGDGRGRRRGGIGEGKEKSFRLGPKTKVFVSFCPSREILAGLPRRPGEAKKFGIAKKAFSPRNPLISHETAEGVFGKA
jgi:hypothetical protein